MFHRFIGSLVTVVQGICHVISLASQPHSTTMSSFVDAPHNFNCSWFLHLKNVPIDHGFPIAIPHVQNFRPRACWAFTTGKNMHKAFILIKVLSHYVSFTSKKRQENIMQVGHMRHIRAV